MKIIEKLFKNFSQHENKRLDKIMLEINSLKSKYANLSDEELFSVTEVFRKNLQSGKTLDEILPEVYAAVREASKRSLGMFPYNSQVKTSISLNDGVVVELDTGEGKTLALTMSAYLNALEGKGVHVLTANEYLAERDCELNSKLFNTLGLTVKYAKDIYKDKDGVLLPQDESNKLLKEAFDADITYATFNTVAFTYLRDNSRKVGEEKVLRDFNYAIIDEADSILIDDARTPIILSSKDEANLEKCILANEFIKSLSTREVEGRFDNKSIDVKDKYYSGVSSNGRKYDVLNTENSSELTEIGYNKLDKFMKKSKMSLDDMETFHHYVDKALQAKYVIKKNKDYIIDKGVIKLIDQNTGRILEDNKYSEGLHQALEVYNGVKSTGFSVTNAKTSHPSICKMYSKVSGLTGTAMNAEKEFNEAYQLGVVRIEPNKESIKKDLGTKVFPTKQRKMQEILQSVMKYQKEKRPILIGVDSVEESIEIDKLLNMFGIKHNTLNAINNSEEAKIISQAGRLGAVTIATSMAGRGTDIKLGGNPEDLALESSKIKNLIKPYINTKEIKDAGKYLYCIKHLNKDYKKLAKLENNELTKEEQIKFKEYVDLYYERTSESFIEMEIKKLKDKTSDNKILQDKFDKLYEEEYLKYKTITDKEKEEVKSVGGLHVIGTTMFQSSRIERQLDGRVGRQGDPGTYEHFYSVEDKMIRSQIKSPDFLDKFKQFAKNNPIGKEIINIINTFKSNIEAKDEKARISNHKYEEVDSKISEIHNKTRNTILEDKDISKKLLDPIISSIEENIDNGYILDLEGKRKEENKDKLYMEMLDYYKPLLGEDIKDLNFKKEELKQLLTNKAKEKLSNISITEDNRKNIIYNVDTLWREYLESNKSIMVSSSFSSYFQNDPYVEYSKQSFERYQDTEKYMIGYISEELLGLKAKENIKEDENTKSKSK